MAPQNEGSPPGKNPRELLVSRYFSQAGLPAPPGEKILSHAIASSSCSLPGDLAQVKEVSLRGEKPSRGSKLPWLSTQEASHR